MYLFHLFYQHQSLPNQSSSPFPHHCLLPSFINSHVYSIFPNYPILSSPPLFTHNLLPIVSQLQRFLAIKGTLTLTQRLYTCICYLCPCQLANISARLAEKERREKKMMNNLAFHKCILAVLKVATNMGEHLYSQISLKVCESEEKPVETTSETPYCTISHVFHQSWHSSKLICKRSSSQCSAHSGQEWSGSTITLNITTTSLQ